MMLTVKPGFHYVNSGSFFDTRQLGPSTRCQKMHPSSRADNSAHQLGPSTLVVETGLYSQDEGRLLCCDLILRPHPVHPRFKGRKRVVVDVVVVMEILTDFCCCFSARIRVHAVRPSRSLPPNHRHRRGHCWVIIRGDTLLFTENLLTVNCTLPVMLYVELQHTHVHRFDDHPSRWMVAGSPWLFLSIHPLKARFPLPELTARVDGWLVSIARQHGPCWRARAFPLAELTGRVWLCGF